MMINELAVVIVRSKYCLILVQVVLSAVLLSGCSKSGPSGNISASAFDSAPPDVKQLWSDGLAAWKSHRYPHAATNFVSLQARTNGFSQQQTDELTKAVEEFGQEAFTAANKGDPAATEAVQAMRAGGRRPAIAK